MEYLLSSFVASSAAQVMIFFAIINCPCIPLLFYLYETLYLYISCTVACMMCLILMAALPVAMVIIGK